MKKRILFAAFLLIFSLSFTACGDDAAKTNGDSKDNEVKQEQKQAEDEITFDDAASHITYASFNSMSLDGMNIDVKASIQGDFTKQLEESMEAKYVPFANELIQGMKLNYNLQYKFDKENKKPMFSLSYGILNNDKKILDVSVFSDEKAVSFALPTLSKKGFSINYHSLAQNMDDEDKEAFAKILKIDFEKYVNLVLEDMTLYEFYEANLSKYKALYDEFLNASITDTKKEGSITEYTLNMDYDKAMDLYKKLLETAKDDIDLQKLIIAKSLLVIDELISSEDYKAMGYDLAELEESKAELEAKKDTGFGEEWTNGIQKAIADLNMANEDKEEILESLKNSNIVYVIKINGNKFDSATVSMDITDPETNETYKITTEAKYGNDVNIAMLESGELFDISGLIQLKSEEMKPYLEENPELLEFIKGFAVDSFTFLAESENMQSIYQLMDKHNLQDDKNMIIMQLQQMKSMFENMSNEQLLMMFGN